MHISTSYVERQNLTLRMTQKRFARLTNGFSKTLTNHAAAVLVRDPLHARHREYITALKFNGVDVHDGHFITDTVDCHECGHHWDKPQEKETDVNIAVHLLDDAYFGFRDRIGARITRSEELKDATH